MDKCVAILISDHEGEYLLCKYPDIVWDNSLGNHGDMLREHLQIMKNQTPDIVFIVAMESTWGESAEDIAFHPIVWQAL